jgi:hypothetical protein
MKEYTKCNSEQFKTNVGIDFCFQVRRPVFGSLRKILGDRRQGDLEEAFDEYYEQLEDLNEDNDEPVDNVKRPKLYLAGPYHYEVKFKLNYTNFILNSFGFYFIN